MKRLLPSLGFLGKQEAENVRAETRAQPSALAPLRATRGGGGGGLADKHARSRPLTISPKTEAGQLTFFFVRELQPSYTVG